MPCYTADCFAEEYQFYHAFAKSRLDRLYPVFYELCILANIHTARYADIVIDINEVAANATVRAFVTRKLREIGIDISLDGCLRTLCSRVMPAFSEQSKTTGCQPRCCDPRLLENSCSGRRAFSLSLEQACDDAISVYRLYPETVHFHASIPLWRNAFLLHGGHDPHHSRDIT